MNENFWLLNRKIKKTIEHFLVVRIFKIQRRLSFYE